MFVTSEVVTPSPQPLDLRVCGPQHSLLRLGEGVRAGQVHISVSLEDMVELDPELARQLEAAAVASDTYTQLANHAAASGHESPRFGSRVWFAIDASFDGQGPIVGSEAASSGDTDEPPSDGLPFEQFYPRDLEPYTAVPANPNTDTSSNHEIFIPPYNVVRVTAQLSKLGSLGVQLRDAATRSSGPGRYATTSLRSILEAHPSAKIDDLAVVTLLASDRRGPIYSDTGTYGGNAALAGATAHEAPQPSVKEPVTPKATVAPTEPVTAALSAGANRLALPAGDEILEGELIETPPDPEFLQAIFGNRYAFVD